MQNFEILTLISAKIILLHVVEEIHHPPTFALSSSERNNLLKNIHKANEGIRKEMVKGIENRIKLCEKDNIQSDFEVVIGSASEEILKVIKKQKIDLVIMSKRKKLKGLKSLLTLGSVSRKIVENTACPVLLVDIEKM